MLLDLKANALINKTPVLYISHSSFVDLLQQEIGVNKYGRIKLLQLLQKWNKSTPEFFQNSLKKFLEINNDIKKQKIQKFLKISSNDFKEFKKMTVEFFGNDKIVLDSSLDELESFLEILQMFHFQRFRFSNPRKGSKEIEFSPREERGKVGRDYGLLKPQANEFTSGKKAKSSSM